MARDTVSAARITALVARSEDVNRAEQDGKYVWVDGRLSASTLGRVRELGWYVSSCGRSGNFTDTMLAPDR